MGLLCKVTEVPYVISFTNIRLYVTTSQRQEKQFFLATSSLNLAQIDSVFSPSLIQSSCSLRMVSQSELCLSNKDPPYFHCSPLDDTDEKIHNWDTNLFWVYTSNPAELPSLLIPH